MLPTILLPLAPKAHTETLSESADCPKIAATGALHFALAWRDWAHMAPMPVGARCPLQMSALTIHANPKRMAQITGVTVLTQEVQQLTMEVGRVGHGIQAGFVVTLASHTALPLFSQSSLILAFNHFCQAVRMRSPWY